MAGALSVFLPLLRASGATVLGTLGFVSIGVLQGELLSFEVGSLFQYLCITVVQPCRVWYHQLILIVTLLYTCIELIYTFSGYMLYCEGQLARL